MKKPEDAHFAITSSEELDPDVAIKEGVLTGSIDPVYAKKAQILNDAIQDIGMGWYQYALQYPIVLEWLLIKVLSHLDGSSSL